MLSLAESELEQGQNERASAVLSDAALPAIAAQLNDPVNKAEAIKRLERALRVFQVPVRSLHSQDGARNGAETFESQLTSSELKKQLIALSNLCKTDGLPLDPADELLQTIAEIQFRCGNYVDSCALATMPRLPYKLVETKWQSRKLFSEHSPFAARIQAVNLLLDCERDVAQSPREARRCLRLASRVLETHFSSMDSAAQAIQIAALAVEKGCLDEMSDRLYSLFRLNKRTVLRCDKNLVDIYASVLNHMARQELRRSSIDLVYDRFVDIGSRSAISVVLPGAGTQEIRLPVASFQMLYKSGGP